MTLIVSHGTKLYADSKIIKGVGNRQLLAAGNGNKLYKIPQACYALSGDSPSTSSHQDSFDSVVAVNVAIIVAIDWLVNNLERASHFEKDQIAKHFSRDVLNYFPIMLAFELAGFLKSMDITMVLKTRYSTIVIADSGCDSFPNEIPYAYGSFGNAGNEMLSMGMSVEDIYRWSHMTNRLTSKQYDFMDPSAEKEMEPDIYNPGLYKVVTSALGRVMKDSFKGGGFNPKSMDSAHKDTYLLEIINLGRLVLSTGYSEWDDKKRTLTNYRHSRATLAKRDLDKIILKELDMECPLHESISFVQAEKNLNKEAK